MPLDYERSAHDEFVLECFMDIHCVTPIIVGFVNGELSLWRSFFKLRRFSIMEGK